MLRMYIRPSDLIRSDKMGILDPTDKYRHILIMGKSYSSLIHDSEVLVESLFEREYLIVECIYMLLWILIIDTVYLGRLDYAVTLELESSENWCWVSSSIGIACTTNTDHNSPLLYMTQGSSSDEVFSNSMCRNCGHDAYINSSCLDCFTYSKSIDYRC